MGQEVLQYARPEGRAERSARVLLRVAWVYPLLPIGSLYLTWLAAWLVLGHRPRPSLDDPRSISWFVEIPYLVTALLLVTMPVGMFVGFGAGFLLTPWWVHSIRGRVAMSVVLMMGLVGLYFGALALIRWDPLGVLYWYMD